MATPKKPASSDKLDLTAKPKAGSAMEREKRLDLLQRSLGIRHKLRVHDSMKAPDTHEDLAVMTLSRWELEDELRAIESILEDTRSAAVQAKRKAVEAQLLAGTPISKKKK